MKEHGRSAADAASGYSAEPEPCSTVSAVPVSIPNAVWSTRPARGGVILENDTRPLRDIVADEMSKVLAWSDRASPYALADAALGVPVIAAALSYLALASAIEARRAETQSGSAHESAVAKPDAQ